MLEAPTYDRMLEKLSWRFRDRDDSDRRCVRLVGIVFAPLGSELVCDQVLPRLQDYHYRSGDNIDFFFAGYGRGGDAPGYRPVPDAPDDCWLYNAAMFDEFRRDFEARTKWQYGGGCELLLCNAIYDENSKIAGLDFSSTVVCDLGRMIADGAIENVESFFEKVFRYAESTTGTDPAWGLSDAMGISGVRSILVRLILSLLPRELNKDVERLKHFAVRDVSPA